MEEEPRKEKQKNAVGAAGGMLVRLKEELSRAQRWDSGN